MRLQVVFLLCVLAMATVSIDACSPPANNEVPSSIILGGQHIQKAVPSYGSIGKAGIKGDLLYAAGPSGIVAVLTYPQGRRVGTLTDLNVEGGICSDSSGNVFIPVNVSVSESTIYEFAHGGTTPIATLTDPGFATACSYDTSTGNLAVANGGPSVAIFEGAQGAPAIYQTSSVPAYFCAFDNVGNLFIDDGFSSSELAELPVGGASFVDIVLNYAFAPVSLQWDTDHLVVAGYTFSQEGPQPLYDVTVTGSEGLVSSPIWLSTKNGRHPAEPVQFWLQGNKIIGPAPHTGGLYLLDFWKYPKGGNPKKTINLHRGTFSGITVSVAMSH